MDSLCWFRISMDNYCPLTSECPSFARKTGVFDDRENRIVHAGFSWDGVPQPVQRIAGAFLPHGQTIAGVQTHCCWRIPALIWPYPHGLQRRRMMRVRLPKRPQIFSFFILCFFSNFFKIAIFNKSYFTIFSTFTAKDIKKDCKSL